MRKRSFIRSSELVDIFRQVPRYSVGSPFLVQGFVLCSLLRSGTARIAAREVHTCSNDASRWTLSFRKFMSVKRALGEFQGVI